MTSIAEKVYRKRAAQLFGIYAGARAKHGDPVSGWFDDLTGAKLEAWLAVAETVEQMIADSCRDLKPSQEPAPIAMQLWCPMCHTRHIDEGEFATKPHTTHACQNPRCGLVWKPAQVPTAGVWNLPGYLNKPPMVTLAGGPGDTPDNPRIWRLPIEVETTREQWLESKCPICTAWRTTCVAMPGHPLTTGDYGPEFHEARRP